MQAKAGLFILSLCAIRAAARFLWHGMGMVLVHGQAGAENDPMNMMISHTLLLSPGACLAGSRT